MYACDSPGKQCILGKVQAVLKLKAEVVVHCHAPITDGRLRVRWQPLFVTGAEADCPGEVVLEATNAKPDLENVAARRLLSPAQLQDGVLSHAVARRLDNAGWRLGSSTDLRTDRRGAETVVGCLTPDNQQRFGNMLMSLRASSSGGSSCFSEFSREAYKLRSVDCGSSRSSVVLCACRKC